MTVFEIRQSCYRQAKFVIRNFCGHFFRRLTKRKSRSNFRLKREMREYNGPVRRLFGWSLAFARRKSQNFSVPQALKYNSGGDLGSCVKDTSFARGSDIPRRASQQ
jgi:hypothetical protein